MGVFGPMAEVNWQSLTAVITAVSPILVAIVGFFLPRLSQDNLRQIQLESETRVKRLEAFEKALSVVEKAKATLEIEVTTNALQNELQQIVHEFAGRAVLSRDSLEEWSRQSLIFRLGVSPNFTVPVEQAVYIRNSKYSIWGFLLVVILYIIIYSQNVFNLRTIVLEYFRELGIESNFWFIMVHFIYILSIYYVMIYNRFRITRQALRIVRAMPESTTAEKTDPLPAEPPPQAPGKDDPR
jgi:hypothetical protein